MPGVKKAKLIEGAAHAISSASGSFTSPRKGGRVWLNDKGHI
jgi:hypothetical protein